MNLTKDQLIKQRDEKAFEWVSKDDGSLGHCPECFQAGFNACMDILWPRLLGLSEAVKIGNADIAAELNMLALDNLNEALKQHGVSDE